MGGWARGTVRRCRERPCARCRGYLLPAACCPCVSATDRLPTLLAVRRMEALTLLRQSVVDKKPVQVDADGVYHMGGKTFPGDTVLPYKRKRSDKFFTLAEVHLFVEVCLSEGSSKYVAACGEKRFIPVPLMMRKPMGQYFQGKIETVPEIEGHSVAGGTGSQAPKDTVMVDAATIAVEEIMALEKPVATRLSILCSKKTNFKIALSFCEMADKDDEVRRGGRGSKKRKTSAMGDNVESSAAKIARAPVMKANYTPHRPIILVPAGSSGLLNLYNIQKFIEEGVYEPIALAKKRLRKPNKVIAKRHHALGVVEFLCLDNVQKMTVNDWKRVVCVVALGALWQFKNWKWKTPAEIFSNAVGFHFNFEGKPVVSGVKALKVAIINVHETSRHRDSMAVKTWWETLDALINIKRPWYSPGVWNLEDSGADQR